MTFYVLLAAALALLVVMAMCFFRRFRRTRTNSSPICMATILFRICVLLLFSVLIVTLTIVWLWK